MSMIQDSMFEEEVRVAQIDEAHVGDIKGAWGTISRGDTAVRRTWFARLLTLLVIMGPGLVTMVGDNDAGGIATYTQAGQNYGTSLLWTLLILIPVLISSVQRLRPGSCSSSSPMWLTSASPPVG